MSPFSNFWFPDLLILSLVFTSFLTCEKVLCFSVFRGVHSRVWTKLYVQLSPGYFCLFFMYFNHSPFYALFNSFLYKFYTFFLYIGLRTKSTQKILTQYCGFLFFGSARRKMLVPQGNIL